MKVLVTCLVVPYDCGSIWIHVSFDIITTDTVLRLIDPGYRNYVEHYAEHCTRLCMLYQQGLYHFVDRPFNHIYRDYVRSNLRVESRYACPLSKTLYSYTPVSGDDMYAMSIAEFIPIESLILGFDL